MNILDASQQIGLSFDDVLLIPNYTEVKRQDIDISSHLTRSIPLRLPLVSSPMDTVTTAPVARALAALGGIGVIHRNMTIPQQARNVASVRLRADHAAAAVGVGEDMLERVAAVVSSGADIIVLDSAHGHSKWIIDATRMIVTTHPQIQVISGNIATAGGAKALIDAGAHALRVGMGPGSICTTRVISGMGVPQLTAIMDAASLAKQFGIPIIADGGIRSSGDIVKAIAAGASCVMIGSLFAGTAEAPGKLVTKNGKKYKHYRGMGSIPAMREGSAARYGQEYRKGKERTLVAEGVEGFVPYTGHIADVVLQMSGGLRTGMYYVGARGIKELQEKTRFLRITPAGVVESHPHDIHAV